MYPFNDSVPLARKGVIWTIRPGPGRYNVQYPRCKRAKTESWVFKSNTGRSEFKPMIYSLFPEWFPTYNVFKTFNKDIYLALFIIRIVSQL